MTAESKIIQKHYHELLKSCEGAYSEPEQKKLRLAYEILISQYNKKGSGIFEEDIITAVGVSKILVEELSLGAVSIISALLRLPAAYDLISQKMVEERFGASTVNVIKGLTKIARLNIQKTDTNAENFIRLLLALSKDVRVILIQLSDTLFHLRNEENEKPDTLLKIAREAEVLYAPLSHRIGLYNIKTEFEDHVLKFKEADAYKSIYSRLDESSKERKSFIREFIKPLDEELIKNKHKCEIKSRVKAISSIWQKMKKQNVGFNEVYDLFAIRIIYEARAEEEKNLAWDIYSLVTNIYPPNPRRLRDWISHPKASGYESLHTTVMGPHGKWVEVQIRSQRMDKLAEKGIAAHWLYKHNAAEKDNLQWLEIIRGKLENPIIDSLDSSVEDAKVELYSNDIFVFTPDNDLKKLSANASVLDFAYHIHTEVGNHCTGAKVNGTIVTLKHILHNGDKVEILTSKNQRPRQAWLNYANTPRTLAKIKRNLKEKDFDQADNGREILLRKLTQNKIAFDQDLLNKLLKAFKCGSPLELYHRIATEEIDFQHIRNILYVDHEAIKEDVKEKTGEAKPLTAQIPPDEMLMIDENADLKDYNLAKCCKPVYGDKIFGFITVGKGIKVHKDNCPNAKQMKSRYPYRIIPARWKSSGEVNYFSARLRITGSDEVGIMGEITKLLAELGVNIKNISFESTENKGFKGSLKVMVKDNAQLDFLINKLLKLKAVNKVNTL